MDENTIKAICVTEIILLPKMKVCRILLVGGAEMDEWAHLVSVIDQWADSLGCKRLESFVRPGVSRKMAKHGMKKIYEVVAKSIIGRVSDEDINQSVH